MIKTIIVLPDGMELSSGVGATNVIQSVTITASVNDANELSLGSACANMVEAKLITPNGGLHIAAGDEIEVYRADEAGTRTKLRHCWIPLNRHSAMCWPRRITMCTFTLPGILPSGAGCFMGQSVSAL